MAQRTWKAGEVEAPQRPCEQHFQLENHTNRNAMKQNIMKILPNTMPVSNMIPDTMPSASYSVDYEGFVPPWFWGIRDQICAPWSSEDECEVEIWLEERSVAHLVDPMLSARSIQGWVAVDILAMTDSGNEHWRAKTFRAARRYITSLTGSNQASYSSSVILRVMILMSFDPVRTGKPAMIMLPFMYTCVNIYIYIHIHTYLYIYI